MEGEFLDDRGVAGGDFEGAAAEAAGAGVFGYGCAGGLLPGGGEVGSRLGCGRSRGR